MLEIGNSSSCTGCAACLNICPVQALSMRADEEGFLRPYIDYSICINCGKCEKFCPILNPIVLPESIKDSYACYALNDTIRLASSSGGIFTLLAQEIIRKHGVVFGAKFTNDFSVIHGWADTEDGIKQFQGSKYVQSYIGSTFSECKKFLEDDRWVLFSGTPCQIGGLRKFLDKDYKKLICIDIICHGVPSPLLWKKYRSEMEKKYKSAIQRTSFRCKHYGWKMFSVLFDFSNNTEYTNTLTKDSYMQLFHHDLCLRNSCYECNFKTLDRISDITIADFWGIEHVVPEMFDDKGTSFVVCHSKKGKDLFNLINSLVKKTSVTIQDGIKFNPSMIKSVNKPKRRTLFFSKINNLSTYQLKKYFIKKSYIVLIKQIAKKILGVKGVDTMKKILGK